MWKSPVGVLLLAAILAGALIAGSPVCGDSTVAASTAGISLGTPASSAGPRIQTPPIVPKVQPASVLLLVVVLALWFAIVWRAGEEADRSPIRWHRPSRRGPPVAV